MTTHTQEDNMDEQIPQTGERYWLELLQHNPDLNPSFRRILVTAFDQGRQAGLLAVAKVLAQLIKEKP
jgi:hypothetical protein